MKKEDYKIVIDNDTLSRYNEYYFETRPRARKIPIERPTHPSINTWSRMRRPQMNALKQKWHDFIIWLVNDLGLANKQIGVCSHCLMWSYYPTRHRKDNDNTTPKFIMDGLVESGFLIDDSNEYIKELRLRSDYDKDNPRTEMYFYLLNEN